MTCRGDPDQYRGHLTSLNMLVIRVECATLQVAHVLCNVTTTSAGDRSNATAAHFLNRFVLESSRMVPETRPDKSYVFVIEPQWDLGDRS